MKMSFNTTTSYTKRFCTRNHNISLAPLCLLLCYDISKLVIIFQDHYFHGYWWETFISIDRNYISCSLNARNIFLPRDILCMKEYNVLCDEKSKFEF